MLNKGKKNSDLITSLPAPNSTFLADILFGVNKASTTYNLDDSGCETVHEDQGNADDQDTITMLNTLVNKPKRKLECAPAIKQGVDTNPATLNALKQHVAPDASAMKLLANQKPGLVVDVINKKSYITLEIPPEQARSLQQKSNCAIRHIKMAISQSTPPPPGLFHPFGQLNLHPLSDVPQQTTQYTVQNYNAAVRSFGGLIDSGVNGGLTDGKNMRVMEMNKGKTIDASGVGNHTINKIPLGVFCTVHHAKPTAFIGVYHNYGLLPGTHGTIHSIIHLQDRGNFIGDTSPMLGGFGCVVVNGGEYRAPLRFKKGLAYLPQKNPQMKN